MNFNIELCSKSYSEYKRLIKLYFEQRKSHNFSDDNQDILKKALLDLYNNLEELRDKINEVIIALNNNNNSCVNTFLNTLNKEGVVTVIKTPKQTSVSILPKLISSSKLFNVNKTDAITIVKNLDK